MVNPNIHSGQGGVTYPSPNEFPVCYRVVEGITRDRQARVTSTDHGFTNADIPVTQVDFSQVKGMSQINGQFAYITAIIDDDNFLIGLDTSQYHAYTSGGFCNILAGNAPFDPFQNTFP